MDLLSYGETFEKFLVFFDQKDHFLRILTLKRKNQIKMVKNKTCATFDAKTGK